MPFRRPRAETRGEAVEELRGERDLRHQDEALPAAPDRVGDCLEIHFGLARAGDAVEQCDRIVAFGDSGLEHCRGGALIGRKFGLNEIRIGPFRDRLRRQHHGRQRAFIDQAVDDASRDAGLARGFALAARHTFGKKREHALPRRRHAGRRRASQTHADTLALVAEMLAHAQAHAQHHAARIHRVICHPIDKAAQLGLKRREFEFLLDILEPIVEPDIGLRILRPHHGGCLPRAERHADDVARGERKPVRHPVRIGPVERDRDQNIDDALFHGSLAIG